MSYVTIEKTGRAGVIGLDRPKALNALDLGMVETIASALDEFEADPAVELVVLRSNHDKMFCAGGDMRRIRELVLENHFEEAEHFFRTEYALILRIESYSKPYVSLIDGICMGGGIGLSMHGKFRIASENALFAMPETAIGFIPDVGGSHILPRMPHHAGYWMGLTGARVKNFDAHALGLSTHMTQAASLGGLFDELCFSRAATETAIENHCGVLGFQESILGLAASTSCFYQPTLCSIEDCLTKSKSTKTNEALRALKLASPRSLQETLSLLKRGVGSTLKTCLMREFEAVQRAIRHPDLVEGVRAVLVDKDHTPVWPSADPRLAGHKPSKLPDLSSSQAML